MRPVPADLLPWSLAALGAADHLAGAHLDIIAGDASNRRYFRLALGARTVVVVDAPPATENNQAFLSVRELLEQAGVRVPRLLAADLERGYLLLEDLGEQMLLSLLRPGTVVDNYRQASDILLLLAAPAVDSSERPDYDEALLTEELARFPQWFLQELLGYRPDAEAQASWHALSAVLVDNALEQPRVLVHRDFHSRNLMPQPDGQLAVIDFQDAVRGPITYDLVSLLRDCYISWPVADVRAWALAHRDALAARGLLGTTTDEQFLRWFDLMGLQRHIKVLGTFARLALRDGKRDYLADLPLVMHYIEQVLTQYAGEEPALTAFGQWFLADVTPLWRQRAWSTGV